MFFLLELQHGFDEQISLDIPIGSENHLQLDASVESKTEKLG